MPVLAFSLGLFTPFHSRLNAASKGGGRQLANDHKFDLIVVGLNGAGIGAQRSMI
jgi:hypothetical protein